MAHPGCEEVAIIEVLELRVETDIGELVGGRYRGDVGDQVRVHPERAEHEGVIPPVLFQRQAPIRRRSENKLDAWRTFPESIS